ncbi:hypothetical protein ACHAPO_012046 [Fusarium lateritium]
MTDVSGVSIQLNQESQDGGELVLVTGNFPIDNAVLQALPAGVKAISTETYGSSAWTFTGKINAKKDDGSDTFFFLKTAIGDEGSVMLRGEFESSKIIHTIKPHLIPEPIAFGQYEQATSPTFFFLSEFVDMETESAPDPDQLGRKLAELHKESQKTTGKFGFHVQTCDGRMPHNVDWQDNWPTFFGNLLKGIYKIDAKVNGHWPEFERATDQIINKVVPRLLGGLTNDGKPIMPCILHGDLWEPNIGKRKNTGELILFDASSFWGHNEMDLGLWRANFCQHLRPNLETYVESYLRHFPAAGPEEEFYDRNRLYSLKATINYSAGHPGSITRHTAYNNMCYLCEKYAPIEGIDKYDPALDPIVSGLGLLPDFEKKD